jgi:hypothetical protein
MTVDMNLRKGVVAKDRPLTHTGVFDIGNGSRLVQECLQPSRVSEPFTSGLLVLLADEQWRDLRLVDPPGMPNAADPSIVWEHPRLELEALLAGGEGLTVELKSSLPTKSTDSIGAALKAVPAFPERQGRCADLRRRWRRCRRLGLTTTQRWQCLVFATRARQCAPSLSIRGGRGRLQADARTTRTKHSGGYRRVACQPVFGTRAICCCVRSVPEPPPGCVSIRNDDRSKRPPSSQAYVRGSTRPTNAVPIAFAFHCRSIVA